MILLGVKYVEKTPVSDFLFYIHRDLFVLQITPCLKIAVNYLLEAVLLGFELDVLRLERSVFILPAVEFASKDCVVLLQGVYLRREEGLKAFELGLEILYGL